MDYILRIEVQLFSVHGQQVYEYHHIYTTNISIVIGNVQIVRQSQILASTATVETRYLEGLTRAAVGTLDA